MDKEERRKQTDEAGPGEARVLHALPSHALLGCGLEGPDRSDNLTRAESGGGEERALALDITLQYIIPPPPPAISAFGCPPNPGV